MKCISCNKIIPYGGYYASREYIPTVTFCKGCTESLPKQDLLKEKDPGGRVFGINTPKEFIDEDEDIDLLEWIDSIVSYRNELIDNGSDKYRKKVEEHIKKTKNK